MRKIFTLFLIALLPTSLVAQVNQTAQNPSIVFTHATAIAVTGAPSKSDMTVIVTGNRISAVGKTGKVRVPKNAQVVDASGKFLIPGLWDMHVHVFNNVSKRPPNEFFFPMMIANGVTSVREMWTKAESMPQIRLWRRQFDEKPGTVPRFAAVGTMVDGKPVSQGNADAVTNVEEARAMVRKLKASGIDFLKTYNKLSRESYFAIADEAKKLNFPFAGHVPWAVTPVEASNAGQKSIEHILGRMMIACSSEQDKYITFPEMTHAVWTEIRDSFSEKKCREVAAVLAKNKTWQVPTLFALAPQDKQRLIQDERLRYIPQRDLSDWMEFLNSQDFAPYESNELNDSLQQLRMKILKIMHQSGVPIMAGTDIGNEFIYPGFSLHDELYLLVQAGLSPFEALKTATINPAKFLGREKELGTIEKGKLADLVLLDANPLADIANTKKINAVVLNGRLLDRNALDKMLADVEAANKK